MFKGTNETSKRSSTVQHEVLTFTGLTPSSDYECTGEMVFENKSFPTPAQAFTTEDGIPGPPLGPVSTSDVGHGDAVLSWIPPEVSNGKILMYRIVLTPQCKEAHVTGITMGK